MCGSRTPIQIKLHIRLSGTEPHFSRQHIFIDQFPFFCRNSQRIWTARLQWPDIHRPLSICSRHSLKFLPVYGNSHFLTGIRFSLNSQQTPMLQYHIVRINFRHLQTAKITGYAFIHRFCQDSRTFLIRMDSIG